MDPANEASVRSAPASNDARSEEANTRRPRRSRPKVKTGCITCNPVRRVKCDEKKPDCLRCTSTGRKCDGYSLFSGDPNQTHDKPPILPPTARSKSSLNVAAIINPRFPVLGNRDETRYFEYFRSRTGPQLAGFFPTEFWSSLILRATFYEPVIKHAVLALSSLHERFANGDRAILNPVWSKGEGGFALTHYNQAIQHLIKPVRQGQQAVDVCLIACMLFSSFETLRGHHGSALSHITSGVKILSEVHANVDGQGSHDTLIVSAHPYAELHTLEVFFNRLHAGVCQMVGARPMVLRSDSPGKEPGFCSEIPAAFSSLEEARNSMDFHWNAHVHILSDIDEPQDPLGMTEANQMLLAANQIKFSTVLKAWSVAFQAFLWKKGRSIDKQGLRAARTLEMSQAFLGLSLQMSSFRDGQAMEMAWDKCSARFKHIVHLASLIVDPTASENVGVKYGPGFCLDTHIIAPLYLIAHRCRDPIIRRKAVAILYSTHRQEGIWDSILTAYVAEKIISIEESGLGFVTCAEDVPPSSRISGVQVKFDLYGRLGAVNYSRLENERQHGRHTLMETIHW